MSEDQNLEPHQEERQEERQEPAMSFKSPTIILATWFGFGVMKPAPGTWGSIGALPFGIVIYMAFGLIPFIVSIALVTAIGWWAAHGFEKRTGIHDSKHVVIDEVAGQWIALIPVFFMLDINAPFIALAFILFRIFDILKPWPVSYFDQKVSGASGVMGDDLVAGFFAASILYGIIRIAGLG
ncbi:MAG: phosphatidylglycerophosphatase A [Micavibrio sp.]|nr:phosphatidylglycerophosphatase A [Micavibrio sp.]